jgi:hypothetical protein
MSTIQVRNINFEPTGNNKITYESSNGYFTLVLDGNRVLDHLSGNINFSVSNFNSSGNFNSANLSSNTLSSNTISSNTLTTNTISSNTLFISSVLTANTLTANTLNVSNISISGSSGNSGQVLTSQGLNSAPIWSTISSIPIASDLRVWTKYIDSGTSFGSISSRTVIDLDSDRQLFIISGGTVQAFVYQKSTDSFGTPILVRAAGAALIRSSAILIATDRVLVCSLGNATTSLQTVVLSISGTTITVNSPVSTTLAVTSTIRTPDSNEYIVPDKLFQVGSSWILEYIDNSNPPQSRLRAITVSDTTPTVGSELSLPNSAALSGPSFAVSSNTALFVRVNISEFIQATPVTVTGTTLTLGNSNTSSVGNFSRSTNTVLVGSYLPSGRIATFAQPGSGNAQGFIIGVSGNTALMTTTDIGFTASPASALPGSFVVGNNQVIVCGESGVNVLTDNSGTAIAGTPIRSLNQAYLYGYSSANTVLIYQGGTRSALRQGSYMEVGISANSPVVIYESSSSSGYLRNSSLSFSFFVPGNSIPNGVGTLRTSSGKHIGIQDIEGTDTMRNFAHSITARSNTDAALSFLPTPITTSYAFLCKANNESEVFSITQASTTIFPNRIFITKIEAI